MRLNLGCGNEYKEGWTNVDRDDKVKAELHIDLEKPLIKWFENDSVDEVYGKYIIEHIQNDNTFFNWLYRICKNNAIVTLFAPVFPGDAAIDWDHKSFWNYRKLHYLDKKNRANDMGLDCNFKIINYEEREELGSLVFKAVLKVVK